MVAKPPLLANRIYISLNLAKIHMVAKLNPDNIMIVSRLNLAKIHMVAKLLKSKTKLDRRLNLAKIHMVAKPQTDFIT